MKKYLYWVFYLVVLFSLSACVIPSGGDNNQTNHGSNDSTDNNQIGEDNKTEESDETGDNTMKHEKFSIMWVTDPQWYTIQFQDILPSQNQWILNNFESLNTKYIVHTGDFLNLPDEPSEWEYASKQYEIWDEANLPYGVLAGNHDVYLGSYVEFQTYFGANRFKDKSCYGGDYDNNRGHYDYVTVGDTEFIFVYLGFGETLNSNGIASGKVTEKDYAWLDEVLSANSDKIAFLAVHEYLSGSGVRTDVGQGLFDNVVLKHPNIRAVLCGHNNGAHRVVDDIDDDGDGVKDRTVYQLMANYQYLNINTDAFRGGNGFFRIMEFDIDAGKISSKTYSPYIDSYNAYPNLESEKDIYGYRDEFVMYFDFSKPKADTDGKVGVVIENKSAKIGDAILPINYLNTTESSGKYNNAGVYDFKFSIDARDALNTNCSYIVTEDQENVGYVVSKVIKNSNSLVPISNNTRVIVVANDAVDSNNNAFDIDSVKIGERVIFDKLYGARTVTQKTGISLSFDDLGLSFIINKVNEVVANDDWNIYDSNWGTSSTGSSQAANTWNYVFAFTPVSGQSGKYTLTAIDTASPAAKDVAIPSGGFVLAINSHSGDNTLRNSFKDNFTIGQIVTISGYTIK